MASAVIDVVVRVDGLAELQRRLVAIARLPEQERDAALALLDGFPLVLVVGDQRDGLKVQIRRR